MKRMPTYEEREVTSRPDGDGDYYVSETNTDYLNKHAEEWTPPLGSDLHLHLVYAHTVHWRVVTRGSGVCRIPGRCHRVSVWFTRGELEVCEIETAALKAERDRLAAQVKVIREQGYYGFTGETLQNMKEGMTAQQMNEWWMKRIAALSEYE